ncbi:MAG: hypothetical protein O3A21_00490, partial [Proteobacteria bacterium]|nr:hypothetical protein [Pseudomonadota bacterium]
MTTIAALAVSPPTVPSAPPVPALVQPSEAFGRQQQEQLSARLPQSERLVRDPRRAPNPNLVKRDRAQLENGAADRTDRQNRARVIPFPGARTAAPSREEALNAPSSVFVAQVLGQLSEPRISTVAFERGIAAYEETTSRTDALTGS